MPQADRHLRWMPGLWPLRRAQIPGEVVAGITLASLAIPEVMGYAKIAGMPLVTGFYTMLVPALLFAVLGSSRHLVVGADSATAAMLAIGLAGIAAAESPEYVALAGALALLAAGLLLLARAFRLGFLANFLSRTVLVGFLTGVGIQVALGQVAGMLGLHNEGREPVVQLVHDARRLAQVNLYSLGLAVAVVAVIVGFRRLSRRIPGPLIALVGATVASWAFRLGAKGVAGLGAVPSGLPTFGLPHLAWSLALLEKLLPIAFGMFIVILAQSAATSRAYANRYDEGLSESGDLLGLGLANIGAALSGTFVVNGSPTKTQIVDSAGGRSQLSQVSAALVALLVMLFFTRPLAYVPEPVLAAVVFLIGVELIDVRGMRSIYFARPWEFWVALITTAIVVLWSVEQGILVAIFLSLVAHTRHGYRPKNTIVVRTAGGQWHALPVSRPAQTSPGLLIYRFSHSMYYANSEQLSEEIRGLVQDAAPPLEWLCIDCTAVDDVDFSAAETLRGLVSPLHERDVRLVLASVSDDVKAELDRSGLTAKLDEHAYYDSIGDVVDAYRP